MLRVLISTTPGDNSCPFHESNRQLSRDRCSKLYVTDLSLLLSYFATSRGALMSSAMLRSLSRAAPSSASLRVHSSRLQIQPAQLPAATCLIEGRGDQRRHASIHAISNPTLAGIEKRWEEMPPQEQAELWMALRDRMKTDWHEMTLQEKKAGMQYRYLVRAVTRLQDPKCCIALETNSLCSACSILGSLRSMGPPRPHTARRKQASLLVHHARRRHLRRPLRP